MAETAVMWFRRDLRLLDHPALAAAAADAAVAPLFVLDPALLGPAGAARTAFVLSAVRALDEQLRDLGARLIVRHGRPETVVPAVAAELEASSVHISADFAPYGAARDARVAEALGDRSLVATGSPYAVSPDRILNAAGDPYRVFTPFFRAWSARPKRSPADSDPTTMQWCMAPSDAIPAAPSTSASIIEAGESAASARWRAFIDRDLAGYAERRNRPDLDGTSRMSADLKIGAIHPRTMLADIAARRSATAEAYRRQLAWREFYATVLHHDPASAQHAVQPAMEHLRWDHGAGADTRFDAWARGETGYPLVDAGMRQLLGEGWMHNRVRMVVASFLVKDLHIDWRRGARHFMTHLIDGDLANNQHGWQWTAGTGTDPAPFFRIFNPISQSRTFDPDGDYIRRWVPELSELRAPAIHEPWNAGALPRGYPQRIVDHGAERQEALARFAATRGR